MRTIDVDLPLYVRLQRLFYIVSPNASMFENLDEVPNYVRESRSAFLVLMVLEIFILWLQCKPMPRVSDVISSVGGGIISRLTGLFLKRAVEIVTYTYVWDNYRLYELPWNSVWTWLFALLSVDFAYYWVHRCAHEVNFMWAAHQMHHSSEDFNLSTALRQSVLHSFSSWIFYLPFALCIPPPIYQVHIQFNLLFQFWIHTEVIGSLGPLQYIINTPSAHKVHHGRNRYCIDKNYGGTFIFFDIVFGTYAAEKTDSFSDTVLYGLVHPLKSSNPIYIQLCHWQHILTTAWNRQGVANKVKTFFYAPKWRPGLSRLGEFTDIPDVKYPQPKYEPQVPMWFTVYAVVHFIPVLAIHEIAHDSLVSLSQLHVILSIGFILLSLTCIGAIYDQRSYAFHVEFCRCAIVSGYLWTRPPYFMKLWLPLLILFVASTAIYGSIIYQNIYRPLANNRPIDQPKKLQ